MGAVTPSLGAVWRLFLLVLSVAVAASAQIIDARKALGPPVELGCSVFVSGDWDYVQNIGTVEWDSSCTSMVTRARQRCGGSRINFVPTHYWADPGTGRGDPTATYQPTNFCYKFSTLFNVQGDCREPTVEEIRAYQGNMTMCFKKAVELGFDIEVTPHLDDGLSQGGWRNALDFDPAVKYGAWSYNDIMLTPLIKALGAAAADNTTVYFAMTGEMSLTVVKYPRSYAALARAYKNPKFQGPQNLKVGVSMNFNKLYTVVLTPEIVKTENISAVAFREMCDLLDFIGISSYSRWATGFKFGRNELEGATHSFMREVANLGVDLHELINVKGKRFHLSEFGVGGGTCGGGTCKATTAAQVSKYPFYGIYGAYQEATDPWQTREVSEFRYHFYNGTLWWLKAGGGPSIRIDAAYVWTLASWDFAGINPQSTSVQGSYYNETVCNLIREYNDWVVDYRAATAPPAPPLPNPAIVAKPTTLRAARVARNTSTKTPPPQRSAPPHFLVTPAVGTPAHDDGGAMPGEAAEVPVAASPAVQPDAQPPQMSVLGEPQEAGSASSQASNTTRKANNKSTEIFGFRIGLERNILLLIACVVGTVILIIIASVVYVIRNVQRRGSDDDDEDPEDQPTVAPRGPPQPDSPLEIYAKTSSVPKGGSLPTPASSTSEQILASQGDYDNSAPPKQVPSSADDCSTPSDQLHASKNDFSAPSKQLRVSKDDSSAPSMQLYTSKDGHPAPSKQLRVSKDDFSAPSKQLPVSRGGCLSLSRCPASDDENPESSRLPPWRAEGKSRPLYHVDSLNTVFTTCVCDKNLPPASPRTAELDKQHVIFAL